MNLGAPELLILLVVILLVLGPSKLPDFARSLGRAHREFGAGIKEGAAEPERPFPPLSRDHEKDHDDGG